MILIKAHIDKLLNKINEYHENIKRQVIPKCSFRAKSMFKEEKLSCDEQTILLSTFVSLSSINF